MGEMLALRWSDIDEEKRTTRISRNLVMAKNRDKKKSDLVFIPIEQLTVKTATSARTIYLGTKGLLTKSSRKRILQEIKMI